MLRSPQNEPSIAIVIAALTLKNIHRILQPFRLPCRHHGFVEIAQVLPFFKHALS
jgi:hypothetical protein